MVLSSVKLDRVFGLAVGMSQQWALDFLIGYNSGSTEVSTLTDDFYRLYTFHVHLERIDAFV